MSVRGTDGPSWKIHVCSKKNWTLLENYKKVAPGKKEQIFSKTVSVAASDCNLWLESKNAVFNTIRRIIFHQNNMDNHQKSQIESRRESNF